MSTEIKPSFTIPVSGVSFRQEVVRRLREGEKVLMVPDPNNEYDSNAIKMVNLAGQMFGFVPKGLTDKLRAHGEGKWGGIVEAVLSGHDTWGVRVHVTHKDVETSIGDAPEPRPATASSASGRTLGVEVRESSTEELVCIRTPDGEEIFYPRSAVELT